MTPSLPVSVPNARSAAIGSGAGSPPVAPPSAEADLVRRLRAGDERAFEEMVRTDGPRLLAVARRILRHDEDARDALQQSLLAAFRALPEFHGDSRLSTWLHRIVVNTALMKLRSRGRRPETSIEELLPQFLEDGHQSEPVNAWQLSAETQLLRQELGTHVRAAIDALPELYRTVLVLRDLEGFDTEETARLVGVPAATVKTRLHRARQALIKLLHPSLKDVS
jgi:RNA polymerase sigma-70 factor (ECF subfamily)